MHNHHRVIISIKITTTSDRPMHDTTQSLISNEQCSFIFLILNIEKKQVLRNNNT